jgi:uncharacterized membrane protein YfcA
MFVLGLALSLLIGVSLGFFGGGGSILTVPLLVYVFGLEPKQAIASSLVIVAVSSVSGAAQHWRAGNVRWQVALFFGLAGMAGAYTGGRVSALVPGGVLLLIFAVIMVATSIAMWIGRRMPTRSTPGWSPGKLLVQGFTVGLFTGLVGAGGGFLIVPALALWAGIPMPVAVGTSLLVIVLNCIAGFTGYAGHVSVDYSLVAAVSAIAISGTFVGSRLALRIDPGSLRRAFAGFVLAMATLILVRESEAVLESAGAALPSTWPQLVFTVLMLSLGVLLGRFSQRPALRSRDYVFEDGEGI